MFARKLLTTGALVTATAAVGSIATQDVDSRWYRKLRKPDFQPSRSVFPIVWPALYASIALASAGVLSVGAKRRAARTRLVTAAGGGEAAEAVAPDNPARGYRRALLANLALNAGWSWTFFRMHDLDLARVTASGLAVSSTDLARRAGRVNKGLGLLLVPYAAWCWFASLLTSRIRALNS
ncbi:TspO and MBR related proteins [Paramicrobacterium humi]|uniref:TspO and MBR related proteins n=1 Tax=Paramicrobacterium humi TaxID=640635 RepID=A0A1H4K2Q5_9MICO|nr:TspO/MBR family protein [Microbacterium humi]SEB52358.1 TspO and MBR related proteins [Microbacterium humi]